MPRPGAAGCPPPGDQLAERIVDIARGLGRCIGDRHGLAIAVLGDGAGLALAVGVGGDEATIGGVVGAVVEAPAVAGDLAIGGVEIDDADRANLASAWLTNPQDA